MCILHASFWNSAAVRKHAALVLLAKQIPIVRGGLKGIEGCIGVLFLRYRGFQEYESAHRSRDRVNGTFSFNQFQCCDPEYLRISNVESVINETKSFSDDLIFLDNSIN